jgi:hypothetical protein
MVAKMATLLTAFAFKGTYKWIFANLKKVPEFLDLRILSLFQIW